MYLIAEFCDALYYTGWHLYFRDSKSVQRNNDGNWGWIRKPYDNVAIVKFLTLLGITIRGDGTSDDDGIAKFAKRFPLKGKICGGRTRGGIEIKMVNGQIKLIDGE